MWNLQRSWQSSSSLPSPQSSWSSHTYFWFTHFPLLQCLLPFGHACNKYNLESVSTKSHLNLRFVVIWLAHLDLTHERQKCLASCESPLLPARIFRQKRFNASSVVRVRLLLRPVPVVLADLGPAGRGECVRLQLVLGLVAEPVGVLGTRGLQLLLSELPGEVVLTEGGDRDQVGSVPERSRTINTGPRCVYQAGD